MCIWRLESGVCERKVICFSSTFHLFYKSQESLWWRQLDRHKKNKYWTFHWNSILSHITAVACKVDASDPGLVDHQWPGVECTAYQTVCLGEVKTVTGEAQCLHHTHLCNLSPPWHPIYPPHTLHTINIRLIMLSLEGKIRISLFQPLISKLKAFVCKIRGKRF